MKLKDILLALVSLSFCLILAADDLGSLETGKRFIETKTYTLEEDKEILAAFEGLRVADVTDGMDAYGLFDTGTIDSAIKPLWKDPIDYKHRIIGIAVTVRYMPTNNPPVPGSKTPEDYRSWEGNWYNTISPEPFAPLLREGSVLVIDDAEDVGSIGSYNIMDWYKRGCVGVVTDSTSRDTDEIITQQIPLYLRGAARGIRPGRNEVESVNLPIVVGDVQVLPGDVIIADGDGVLCVRRDYALRVAEYAHKILDADKGGRRSLYEELGREMDASTE